jgi:glycosyltransferase involved in cell wall biosynthesis
MRCLFCCEYYHPSRGGVQEVMRQIAERLVAAGHEVTVATTKLTERDFTELNGVHIVEFAIKGNAVRGIEGEVERYRSFLTSFPADALLIKAAQQWTFDAAFDVLDKIRARKVFIPCGFSGLHTPTYKTYFDALPEILQKFDRLIFYAERYRDIDFVRTQGLDNITILTNGASDIEFSVPRDPTFRQRHGIGKEDIVLLTVGSPITMKGHAEVAAAFSQLVRVNTSRQMTLILNGQWNGANRKSGVVVDGASANLSSIRRIGSELYWRYRALSDRTLTAPAHLARYLLKTSQAVALPLFKRLAMKLKTSSGLPVDYWIHMANRHPCKTVLKTHLPRDDTVQAFMNADLFVFASNVEYSPLVLFEAAAAGTPFLTVPVGNSEEIARWTGGGVVCPAELDARGYTRVDPKVLAKHIARLLDDPDRLRELGAAGRRAWETDYNWKAIAKRYEAVLRGDVGSQ